MILSKQHNQKDLEFKKKPDYKSSLAFYQT